MAFLLEALPLIQAVLLTAGVMLGIRQVRFLRELTGERSVMSSLLAWSWRRPRQPTARYLRAQPHITFFQRDAIRARSLKRPVPRRRSFP